MHRRAAPTEGRERKKGTPNGQDWRQRRSGSRAGDVVQKNEMNRPCSRFYFPRQSGSQTSTKDAKGPSISSRRPFMRVASSTTSPSAMMQLAPLLSSDRGALFDTRLEYDLQDHDVEHPTHARLAITTSNKDALGCAKRGKDILPQTDSCVLHRR